MPLIEFRKEGIFVPGANCYIDPHQKVDCALITHAHSDHVRKGCQKYITTDITNKILKVRYGIQNGETRPFGEEFVIHGIRFSFHPAGHIPGSAQVRVTDGHEVWVVTGDFKRERDHLCEDFEILTCDHLVMESTFGLPVYRWDSENKIQQAVMAWWADNQNKGLATILTGYSLGKAQRLLQLIEEPIGPVYVHPSVDRMNDVLKEAGIELNPAESTEIQADGHDFSASLIIAPPSALNSPWIKEVGNYSAATASGWNRVRRMRRGVADRHFVISDHADWQALNTTVEESGARHIYVMHGYSRELAAHLCDRGFDAVDIEHPVQGRS